MREKLKLLLTDDSLYFALLVCLVGVASFGLGRMSVDLSPVRPSESTVELLGSPEQLPEGGVSVVASENGTKYHLPECPSAERINPENRVQFASVMLAEAAGYEPAANCPGL